jgi:hypothetical protein
MNCEISYIANLVTIIGFFLGLISLGLVVKSIRQQNQAIEKETQIAKANTLIALRESFQKHLSIHKKIWNQEYNDEEIPADELVDVMSYLGQLEILLPLSEKFCLINEEELQNQYGFRITRLTHNNAILNHINENRESYKSLIKLLEYYANY